MKIKKGQMTALWTRSRSLALTKISAQPLLPTEKPRLVNADGSLGAFWIDPQVVSVGGRGTW